MSPHPAVRKRLTAAPVVVLSLAAGTLLGDRFIPFRGASDGDSDDQRLTIAAIAARLANHAVLEAGCLTPLAVADESPAFAS